MSLDSSHPNRRDFLGLGLAVASTAGAAAFAPLLAEPHGINASEWDMSWTEEIGKARYKAAFDSTNLNDGSALDLAAGIWDNFKEAYGTDEGVRMVVIMRQLGQVMAFNDKMWQKYGIGEERKVNDPLTKQSATRNPFASAVAGEPSWAVGAKLDALYKRGAVFLVCNRASMNWAASAAERTNRPVDEVRADVRANLVPGAFLMPTGVFALVRAQNAGCAYMRGS